MRGLLDAFLPFSEPAHTRLHLDARHRVELACATVAVILCVLWAIVRRDLIFAKDAAGNVADPMAASGFITALATLMLSLFVDRRYLTMMRQIEAEKLVRLSSAQLEALHETVQNVCLILRYGVMLAVLLSMIVGYFTFFGWPEDRYRVEFFLGSWLLGALAGHRLGSAAAYGTFATLLRRSGGDLRLVPGHYDGAGGANQIGGFLVFQGVLAAVPLIWLTVWIWLIDGWASYADWRTHFYVLWIIAAFVMYMGCAMPVISLTRVFARAKGDAAARMLPATLAEIETAHDTLSKTTDFEDGMAAKVRLNEALDFRRSIVPLPTLPLSSVSRQFFGAASLLPIISILIEVFVKEDSLIGKIFANAVGAIGVIFK